jgi:hypothetical protein
MWKGSGYRGMPVGVNKNTGKGPYTGKTIGFNMVYEENLGRLSVAFPFSAYPGPPGGWSSNSMCLGVQLYYEQVPNPDEGIPAIISFYLSHGQGSYFWTNVFEQVLNGYWQPPAVSSGSVGYDTPRTRDQYRGGIVNLTFTPIPGSPPVTMNVTITDALFPDNLTWTPGSVGIPLGTYTWPLYPGPWTPAPYWTINSLTMPS